MPGWAAAAEVMHRGVHYPHDSEQTCNVACMTMQSLSLLMQAVGQPALLESISLSATVRKLLLPHLKMDKQPASNMAASMHGISIPAAGPGQIHVQQLDLHVLQTLISSMVCVIETLDRLLKYSQDQCSEIAPISISNDSNSSSGSSRGSFNRGSSSGSFNRGSGGGHSMVSRNGSTGVDVSQRTSGEGEAGITQPLSPLLIHQLQAITLLTLVQISQWVKACKSRLMTFQAICPDWLTAVLQAYSKMDNSHLSVFAASLLDDSSGSGVMSQGEVDRAWERYAVTHFDGRLLPGCCCFGCTNLSGVSEAALKTLLCSGCRRARYCSTECQRAAWVEAGHSTVCGKSGVIDL